MGNVFTTPDGKKYRIISLVINDTLHDVEGLKSFNRPSVNVPYWIFTFQDNTIIEATGNITMMRVPMKEEK